MQYMKLAELDSNMTRMVVAFLKGLPNDSCQASLEKITSLTTSDIDDMLTMNDNQLGLHYTKAFKWYSIAKNSGHIGTTYCLGKLHKMGLRVVQDCGYAVHLYNSVKNGGCLEAIFALGN
ncbi:hypothetical protein K501DRAFT_278172 [Backusella circina FSU 941]|nr:hypothetical protein K501DRAFT_278172 [Backusella circina FSU 941]